MSLSERHVVITGGGSGVGACMAQVFAGADARVTILGRRQAPLDAVAGETGALALSCDVTDRAALDEALSRATELHGPVAIAIANAGQAESAPFHRVSAQDLTGSLSVNLMGVFHLWQAALADMRGEGWGRMIAVASIAGLDGAPYVSAYCAAKHGVVGLTRALAKELATDGITVNALCPGYVETPMLERTIANITEKTGQTPEEAAKALLRNNPQKRFIQANEVAQAALWLCSDGAAAVNGHELSISGGEI